jgi:hypothetical protein
MASHQRMYFGHQWFWIVIAILINIYSYSRIAAGGEALTTTAPESGIFVFLVYIPFLVLGHLGKHRLYLAGTVAFVVLIALGGILKHLAAALEPNGLEAYASTFWWAVAIAVNVYGVVMSVMACLTVRKLMR